MSLLFLCPSSSTSVYWNCLVIAGPLAPPPPSMQITPQLPLMGFVARVQETSKWLLAPRSPCMTTICFKSSPQRLLPVIPPAFGVISSYWSGQPPTSARSGICCLLTWDLLWVVSESSSWGTWGGDRSRSPCYSLMRWNTARQTHVHKNCKKRLFPTSQSDPVTLCF